MGLGPLLVVSATADILQRDVVTDTAWPHPTAVAPAAGLAAAIFFFPNSWGPYPSLRGDGVRTQDQDR